MIENIIKDLPFKYVMELDTNTQRNLLKVEQGLLYVSQFHGNNKSSPVANVFKLDKYSKTDVNTFLKYRTFLEAENLNEAIKTEPNIIILKKKDNTCTVSLNNDFIILMKYSMVFGRLRNKSLWKSISKKYSLGSFYVALNYNKVEQSYILLHNMLSLDMLFKKIKDLSILKSCEYL